MGYIWCLFKYADLANVIYQKLQSIGLITMKVLKITNRIKYIENESKVKGKQIENFHYEIMNCFEMLMIKIQDKRNGKR